MKKTKLAMVLFMGMVACGYGQMRSQLIVVSTTDHSVTLELQAGSDAIMEGFTVQFQRVHHTKRSLFISGDAPDCLQFELQPGQISPPFTIDGFTNSDCLTYNQPQPLVCAEQYRFFAKANGVMSTGVTTLTQQCP